MNAPQHFQQPLPHLPTDIVPLSADNPAVTARTFSELEAHLMSSIKQCHDNVEYLHRQQTGIAPKLDEFVDVLKQIYIAADTLYDKPPTMTNPAPQPYSVPRHIMLEIDAGTNPLLHLRKQVNSVQNENDTLRGKMAQIEIFRDAVDAFMQQSIAHEEHILPPQLQQQPPS